MERRAGVRGPEGVADPFLVGDQARRGEHIRPLQPVDGPLGLLVADGHQGDGEDHEAEQLGHRQAAGDAPRTPGGSGRVAADAQARLIHPVSHRRSRRPAHRESSLWSVDVMSRRLPDVVCAMNFMTARVM
ncbi:hypothetical protein ACFFX0_06585 [Citricoccus parietis]|uniref:Uncharacterized protein n=1 Tax=Citricoccus parietis TaxID=592307 RepID=A0ABV5FW08_9MICC